MKWKPATNRTIYTADTSLTHVRANPCCHCSRVPGCVISLKREWGGFAWSGIKQSPPWKEASPAQSKDLVFGKATFYFYIIKLKTITSIIIITIIIISITDFRRGINLLVFVSQFTGVRIFSVVGRPFVLYSESSATKDSLWVWNQPTDHAPNTTNKLPVYI